MTTLDQQAVQHHLQDLAVSYQLFNVEHGQVRAVPI